MTDISELCSELEDRIEWQRLPPTVSSGDREDLIRKAIVSAIEDLFVVTGREFSDADKEIYDKDKWNYTLKLDEKLYILCVAQINVLSKVRTMYNDIIGYTTNALTVTNADKPYMYLTGSIDELKTQKELYYYKMVRYSHFG